MNSLAPLADIPFFVIHLPRTQERESLIQALRETLQHPLLLADAIDGSTDPRIASHPNRYPHLYPRIYPHTQTAFNTQTRLSEIGCLLSHLQLFHWMIERNVPYIGVFEDDAECLVPAATVDEFVTTANQTVPNWDILFLGGNEWVAAIPVANGLVRVDCFWGAHAYLITLAAAKASLADYEFLAAAGCAYPFDWHLAYTIQKHRLRAFGPMNPKQLFRQRPGFVSQITGKVRS